VIYAVIMNLSSKSVFPSKETIRKRCTTLEAWALPKQESTIAPDYVWTNKDMDPVPIADQTWGMWTWIA
jgi:NCS1 family nucleobase:cation symporter-1